MKISKSYKVTKTYEIQCLFPKKFSWKLSEFKKVNAKILNECFVCEHKFDKDEQVYLASIVGTENQLICNNCWDRINTELNSDKNERRTEIKI